MSAEPSEAALLQQLSPSRKRELGCFLTPLPVADLMASLLVDCLAPGGTVIDPAAGTGRLLTSVADRLAKDDTLSRVASRIRGIELESALADWTNHQFQSRMGARRPICVVANALSLLSADRRREILGSESFAGVIANPPYVREKHHRHLFAQVLEMAPQWRGYFTPRQDMQQLFLLLGLHLLQPGGHLVFLMNPYWFHSDSGQGLRHLVQERAEWVTLIDFSEIALFPEAPGQHSVLIHLRDRRAGPCSREKACLVRVRPRPRVGLDVLCRDLSRVVAGDPGPDYLEVSREAEILMDGPRRRFYIPSRGDVLVARLQADCVPLGALFSTHQGIISGADRVTLHNRIWVPQDIPVGTGIFVLSLEELSSLELSEQEQGYIMPMIRARQVQPFAIAAARPEPFFLLYLDQDSTLEACPRLRNHLERFRTLLQRRREVQTGRIAWYQLQWPRDRSLFERPRIVTPRRALYPRFALGRESHCEQSDIAMITSPDDDRKRLEALLVLLNSDLAAHWAAHRGKRKGPVREFFGRALEEFPLPRIILEDPPRFDSLSRFATGRQREEANRCVAGLFGC